MNVLVTGGAGNIGTNLCNELRSRGHKVIACDLYNTERDDYIRCDVRNYRQLQYVFDKFDKFKIGSAAAAFTKLRKNGNNGNFFFERFRFPINWIARMTLTNKDLTEVML